MVETETTISNSWVRTDIKISPCAKDSHNVAIEMHNDVVKNVVSKERTPLKVISVAKLIFEL
jgi:hypothetical protein